MESQSRRTKIVDMRELKAIKFGEEGRGGFHFNVKSMMLIQNQTHVGKLENR